MFSPRRHCHPDGGRNKWSRDSPRHSPAFVVGFPLSRSHLFPEPSIVADRSELKCSQPTCLGRLLASAIFFAVHGHAAVAGWFRWHPAAGGVVRFCVGCTGGGGRVEFFRGRIAAAPAGVVDCARLFGGASVLLYFTASSTGLAGATLLNYTRRSGRCYSVALLKERPRRTPSCAGADPDRRCVDRRQRGRKLGVSGWTWC